MRVQLTLQGGISVVDVFLGHEYWLIIQLRAVDLTRSAIHIRNLKREVTIDSKPLFESKPFVLNISNNQLYGNLTYTLRKFGFIVDFFGNFFEINL